MNKTLLLATVISAILISGLLTLNEMSFAEGKGKIKATAVVARTLGNGVVTCPDQTTIEILGNRLFTFNKDGVGPFSVNSLSLTENELVLPPTSVQSTLVSGKVNQKNYFINGIVTFDDMCNLVNPTTISVSGNCGLDQEIMIETATGMTANIRANVACA